MSRRFALCFEFAALCVGVPLVVLRYRQLAVVALVLWVAAYAMHRVLRRRHAMPLAARCKASLPGSDARFVLMRFAVLASMLTVGVAYFTPELFLSLPRQHTGLWLAVLALYPVFSVWPQEVIYRAFLFDRYRALFGDRLGYLAASALAFGYMHVIFGNWVAPAMTAAGGLLFASTYRRQRSLWLCCVEHALYGALVFTVGLHRYFLI